MGPHSGSPQNVRSLRGPAGVPAFCRTSSTILTGRDVTGTVVSGMNCCDVLSDAGRCSLVVLSLPERTQIGR